jgi:hypothetical protein
MEVSFHSVSLLLYPRKLHIYNTLKLLYIFLEGGREGGRERGGRGREGERGRKREGERERERERGRERGYCKRLLAHDIT